MKTFTSNLLLSAALIMLIAACSKNKDSNHVKPIPSPQTATAADIAGKWYIKADSTFTTDDNGATKVAVNQYDHTLYYLFNADGSGELNEQDSTLYKLHFTLNAGALTLTYIEKNGDTLDPLKAHLLLLTATNLEISATIGKSTEHAFCEK